MEAETISETPIPVAHQLTGSVRKLKDGYGFIAGDDGHDYFFHWSAMKIGAKDFRELQVRERVSFDVVSVKSKIRGVNVNPV